MICASKNNIIISLLCDMWTYLLREREKERVREIFKELLCLHGEKYLLIFYKLSVSAGEF